MINYYFFETLNLVFTCLPVAVGLVRFRHVDYASRIFLTLLAISFLTESIAFLTAVRYGNNMTVYNISNIIQIFFLAWYFNECTTILKKRNIGIYVGVLSILIGILNILFLQPIKTYNSNYFLFQVVLIIVMAMILYVQLIFSPKYTEVYKLPQFWFTLILLIFYVLNFMNLSLYDYFTVNYKGRKYIVDISISILNDLSNLGFALIFFLYPKRLVKNV